MLARYNTICFEKSNRLKWSISKNDIFWTKIRFLDIYVADNLQINIKTIITSSPKTFHENFTD